MSDKKRHRLQIAYDGTAYFGWQDTGSGPSIEGHLRSALEQLLQEKMELEAASRTDKGVHAEGQVAAFTSKKGPASPVNINALLPPDIRVLQIQEVSPQFHPALDSVKKEYRYDVCPGAVQLPKHRNTSWHVHAQVDRELMQKGCELLKGTRDFSAFCNVKKNESYRDKVRTLHDALLIALPDNRLRITLVADRFLYKMARNLAGHLVELGKKRLTLQEFADILQNRDRKKASVCAPAHGLTLHKVYYAS